MVDWFEVVDIESPDAVVPFARTLLDGTDREQLWRTLVMAIDLSADADTPVSPAPKRFQVGFGVFLGLSNAPGDIKSDISQDMCR